MTGTSVPEAGTPPSRSEALADAVEAELDRLRRARPHLSSRVDRASQILLMQLASPPRQRPIRCRIGQGGRYRRCLVRSSTESGGVYVVQGRHFECSCPDHHRHGAGCKHSIACWILSRVTVVSHARPRSELGCAHCVNGWISLGEDLVDAQSGELAHAENFVRCRRCRPTARGLLSVEELEEWMRDQRWIYAKTMPAHPHEYCLKREQDTRLFERVVETILAEGWNRRYLGRLWRTMHIGEHICWIHTPPGEAEAMPLAELLEATVLLNRTRNDQPRLVDVHKSG